MSIFGKFPSVNYQTENRDESDSRIHENMKIDILYHRTVPFIMTNIISQDPEYIFNTTSHKLTVTPPDGGTIDGRPTIVVEPSARVGLIRGEGNQWHTVGAPSLERIEYVSPRNEIRLQSHTTMKRVENPVGGGSVVVYSPPGESFADGTVIHLLDPGRVIYVMRTAEGKWKIFSAIHP